MPEVTSIAYRVLNAARSWRYLETGDLGSKVEGAAWLKHQHAGPEVDALLEAALAFQWGEAPEFPDERTVDAFADRVEAMLRSEIAGG